VTKLWQRLNHSDAFHHDSLKLELPRAWEPRSNSYLYGMVRKKRPTFLFIMETKSMKHKMESKRVKLGFAGFFVVNLVGRSVVKMTDNTTPLLCQILPKLIYNI
jgi:hypothetical protein